MNDENFSQQQLFEQEKYISDLIEKKSDKKKSSINIVFGASLISSGIVLSFLFLFGLFDEEEVVIHPDNPNVAIAATTKTKVLFIISSIRLLHAKVLTKD